MSKMWGSWLFSFKIFRNYELILTCTFFKNKFNEGVPLSSKKKDLRGIYPEPVEGIPNAIITTAEQ